MELALVVRAAMAALRQQLSILARRVLAGSVMTSIDMQGISITLLSLDDDLLALLDAPTASLAWLGGAVGVHPDASGPRLEQVPLPPAPPEDSADDGDPDGQVRAAVDRACQALLDAEAELTRMD